MSSTLGIKLKAWETIRLLLACQHAYARLYKISTIRSEFQNRLSASQDEKEKMKAKINGIEADISAINRKIKTADEELANLKAQKSKLRKEGTRAKSNEKYEVLNQKIKENDKKIDDL